MSAARLRHPLLDAVGVRHGFGLRDLPSPREVVQPRQVHGICVALAKAGRSDPAEADAIVSADPLVPVGIVTADCVPVLAASAEGAVVVAIHAGWQGLAAGVVEKGMAALRHASVAPFNPVAVIGPHIGPCCYEVDEPVVGPLRSRFGGFVDSALRLVAPQRPGHWLLDLGFLVALELERAGVRAPNRGRIPEGCTFCHPSRFHSYRREGDRAGRLLHYVQPKRGS
jgi:YfiH family protein